jgi:hypothetical protein
MRGRPRLSVLALAASMLAGCGEGSPGAPSTPEATWHTLVAYDAWSGVARADDPFVTAAEQPPECLGPGFYAEPDLGWLEIDTGECSWVTLSASAAVPVESGKSLLRITMSHYDLNAPTPARAELALRLGDCDVWSKSVKIPGPAAVDTEELTSPCASAAGGPVLLHLHNHGQNTWQLQELAVLR